MLMLIYHQNACLAACGFHTCRASGLSGRLPFLVTKRLIHSLASSAIRTNSYAVTQVGRRPQRRSSSLAMCELLLSLSSTATCGVNSSLPSHVHEQTVILSRRSFPLFRT